MDIISCLLMLFEVIEWGLFVKVVEFRNIDCLVILK